MRALRTLALSICVVLLGCGSSTPAPAPARVAAITPPRHPARQHPKSPPRPSATPAKRPASPPPAELPSLCTGEGKTCYPPEDFVGLLCQKKYPGVAIKMFIDKATPWKRGYIQVKDVAPINSHGGPSANTRLEFLEEVIVLRERPNKYRKMVDAIITTFDVFRFDGTCATLAEDEFMTKKPALPPRYAPFVWSQIDPSLRRALSDDPKVETARLSQTEYCHGQILTGGAGPCRDATQQLARAILKASSTGLDLPLPDAMPNWSTLRAGSEAAAGAR